jgi:hypothetical protein
MAAGDFAQKLGVVLKAMNLSRGRLAQTVGVDKSVAAGHQVARGLLEKICRLVLDEKCIAYSEALDLPVLMKMTVAAELRSDRGFGNDIQAHAQQRCGCCRRALLTAQQDRRC